MQQFQNVMLLCLCRLQQEPFINDEKNGVGVLCLNSLVGAICTCQIKLKKHIRQANVLRFVSLLAGFHTESAGHVGFAAPGSPSDEQVPMLRDVFASCQSFDQAAVEFPARSIVDVSNVSLRLVKSSTFDQALQAVAFTIVVFDVDQKAEAVLEGNILHLRVIHLGDKGI